MTEFAALKAADAAESGTKSNVQGFNHTAFERADLENNTAYFEEQKLNGYLDAMLFHRRMTCFDWKNFDVWIQRQQLGDAIVRDKLSSELEALMTEGSTPAAPAMKKLVPKVRLQSSKSPAEPSTGTKRAFRIDVRKSPHTVKGILM